MPYGFKDGNIRWRGYGIESIVTFLNDVIALKGGLKKLSDLQLERPSFQESLISTMVIEAAHHSLENSSKWQIIETSK
jgi:hypothetical protein